MIEMTVIIQTANPLHCLFISNNCHSAYLVKYGIMEELIL